MIKNTFHFYETMLIKDGAIQNFNEHRIRIQQTIAFLKAPEVVDEIPLQPWINSTLQEVPKSKEAMRLRVDLVLHQNSFKSYRETSKLRNYPECYQLRLDPLAVRHSGDPLWQYKLADTQRNLFFKSNDPNTDCIFVNEKKEICETTIANIYLKSGDTLLTPPISAGVLAGTYRSMLLKKGIVKIKKDVFKVLEAPIPAELLTKESELFVSNALMGIRKAKLI